MGIRQKLCLSPRLPDEIHYDPPMLELPHIEIRGAKEHNLQSIDLRIPKKKLVVLTGVSGSGKSSLAFDTLYAEGQRRYVESLSAYARQFLDQMEKPRYDSIRGLSPTISIEQKTTGNNPRSTVGTITEIADYLRVLYARIGVQHCHQCGELVSAQSAEEICKELLRFPEGSKLTILAPVLENRKGEHRELIERLRQDGFMRLRIDGEIILAEEIESLDKRRKHNLEAVVDRIVIKKKERSRILDSIETALRVGKGTLISLIGNKDEYIFSEHHACHHCGISFPSLTPQSFSFNSPQGMCQHCNGLGSIVEMDPELIIPDFGLSINQGAIKPWGEQVKDNHSWGHGFRSQVLAQLKIDLDRPWRRLTAKQRDTILYGAGEQRFRVKWKSRSSKGTFDVEFEGVIPRMMRRFMATKSERAKRWYSQFLGSTECRFCKGARLRPESIAVLVGKTSLVDLSEKTIDDAIGFFNKLRLKGNDRTIADELLKEIRGRLHFLKAVGLGYLSLDRAGPTLSGGESQRIRLASQVGSELTGVIYILDEPSIGLHQRDNAKLLETLKHLRDIGNTVVVVEHDEETIRKANHIIDFGPGAGIAGGTVVHTGTPASLARNRKSLTGGYLSGRLAINPPDQVRIAKGSIKIENASENNLKNIDVEIPLGILVAVTGVSGAGKSTLVNDILSPALARTYHGSTQRAGKHTTIHGTGQLDKIVSIDQRPIGRTPRSNPATYIKVFDEIRSVFSKLPEARLRGYSPGRFSFNVKGGRCEHCEGDGVRKIEMHFLPDVYVRCEQCDGKRFNEATLEVRYRDHHIADVLELTIREALELFSAHPKIARSLQLLADVGLEYMHLGQPSPTLSGGEAQRIKLARELSRPTTGKTLYVLDEPTTGLHFDDIKKLLLVLNRLVDSGNSVIVIEHNLDVIKSADWLIDMGPEGGPAGGKIVAKGTPHAVAKRKNSHTGKYLAKLFTSQPDRRRKNAK